jgi:hypothetical protein
VSIVRAATNTYGPGTVDLQIEQGASFSIGVKLKKTNGLGVLVDWDLTNATITAKLNQSWMPSAGSNCIPMTVNITAPLTGDVTVSLTAAATGALVVPFTPAISPANVSSTMPRKVKLGGWVLDVLDGGVLTRVLEGDVQLDRDPCLM